jgi:GTPase
MKFVDETEITVRSGHGGAGMVSFASAKFAPKLGPDGGDGGFGGSVYLVGHGQLNSLSGLYYRRIYQAEDGVRGGSNGKTGRNGEDLEIQVPVGTMAFSQETGELLCEILEDGERICIAPGGKRGLGNIRFVSATHQAPEEHTKGGPGVTFDLRLELKLIADVGFAGFPNAGKSTLLSSISAARPKIADYPFTTLTPQLGVVAVPEVDPYTASFVAADIPGLIEGAAEGKGLGHDFLRHLERTKVIVYVIDPFAWDEMPPIEAYETLQNELASFGEKLAQKRSLVVLTKGDIAPEDMDWAKVEQPFRELGLEVVRISAVAQKGLGELKRRLYGLVEEEKRKIVAEADEAQADAVTTRDASYQWMTRDTEDLGLDI